MAGEFSITRITRPGLKVIVRFQHASATKKSFLETADTEVCVFHTKQVVTQSCMTVPVLLTIRLSPGETEKDI